MNIMSQSVLVALAGVLLAGCESPGRSLAKSAVQQIRDGQTTRPEIEKIFGEPMQVIKSPQGKTLYLYQRFYGPDVYSNSGFAAPRRDEANLLRLSVLFSSSDIVEKHLYSHTQPDIDRIRRNTGRKLGTEELAKIQPGKTSQSELMNWFGPFWSEELTLNGGRLVVWLYADAYNFGGRVELQALEVILDDSNKVLTFRVTKQDPWKN